VWGKPFPSCSLPREARDTAPLWGVWGEEQMAKPRNLILCRQRPFQGDDPLLSKNEIPLRFAVRMTLKQLPSTEAVATNVT
jgi:hypothetical protein